MTVCFVVSRSRCNGTHGFAQMLLSDPGQKPENQSKGPQEAGIPQGLYHCFYQVGVLSKEFRAPSKACGIPFGLI